jgi:methylmalonyl-CoA mutase
VQLILADETGITKVADPWGGSYFMETLTKQMEDKAAALIDEVEKLGGMTEAIISGSNPAPGLLHQGGEGG